MMRPALEKIVALYKTSPVFQDLLETAAGTALAAGGQAIATDMTPEEIALASAGAFGAGMVGRPIVGQVGQVIGKYADKSLPKSSASIASYLRGEGAPSDNVSVEAIRQALITKAAPFANLGGYEATGQIIGRQYGDNIAQLAVALAAPSIFGGEDNA